MAEKPSQRRSSLEKLKHEWNTIRLSSLIDGAICCMLGFQQRTIRVATDHSRCNGSFPLQPIIPVAMELYYIAGIITPVAMLQCFIAVAIPVAMNHSRRNGSFNSPGDSRLSPSGSPWAALTQSTCHWHFPTTHNGWLDGLISSIVHQFSPCRDNFSPRSHHTCDGVCWHTYLADL